MRARRAGHEPDARQHEAPVAVDTERPVRQGAGGHNRLGQADTGIHRPVAQRPDAAVAKHLGGNTYPVAGLQESALTQSWPTEVRQRFHARREAVQGLRRYGTVSNGECLF